MNKSTFFAVIFCLCACGSDPYIDRTPDDVVVITDASAPIQEDASIQDATTDLTGINDHTIFPTVDSNSDSQGPAHCPDTCLQYGTSFDCNQRELDCIAVYHPSWAQMCFQEKRYCSLNDWSMWCLTQRYSCEGDCTTACQNCVATNACMVASYECPEACHQE